MNWFEISESCAQLSVNYMWGQTDNAAGLQAPSQVKPRYGPKLNPEN